MKNKQIHGDRDTGANPVVGAETQGPLEERRIRQNHQEARAGEGGGMREEEGGGGGRREEEGRRKGDGRKQKSRTITRGEEKT